jgi:Arc/MetJ-type ribon-helix-helix transcriptional regulator
LIRQTAAESHVSMAEAIRQGIELLLQQKFVPPHEQRVQRALAAAGLFHSGYSDTSAEHDDALTEAYQS